MSAWDIPIDLGPDPARDLARRELAKAVYQADRPSWFERALTWVGDRLGDLLAAADARSAGGVGGVVVLVVVLAIVGLVVRRRLGRVGRRTRGATPLFDAPPRTAEDHRRSAREAAAAGRHDEAVREGMRALVRGLEERDLLEPRAGRTVGEAVREAARVVPDAADAVRDAGRRFDEVVYGGRAADASASAVLRDADDRVRAARPAPLVGAV